MKFSFWFLLFFCVFVALISEHSPRHFIFGHLNFRYVFAYLFMVHSIPWENTQNVEVIVLRCDTVSMQVGR
jgi:hypothetical protein